MKIRLLFLIGLSLIIKPVIGQENTGLASGNYSGVSGIWMNPANIVDSRYKFDIAVFGSESYFDNNFLLIKNGTLLRKLFSKEPYNSSFSAVKQDLLFPVQGLEVPVKAYASSEWQLPLSFLATTGPQSAISLNMRNRSVMTVENLNPETALMLFNELQNSESFNQVQNNDGFQFNFLNWRGLTLLMEEF
ncbi:MAG: hypothetical protein IPP71_16865 [Bacteroidetes bacterium]|nr:hypothetical protein [Bacteroidota bacterium]